MSIRKKICDAIASACTSDAPQDVDARLDEIFASYFEEGIAGVNEVADDDNVTPLMLACDKRCSEALQYLQKQIKESDNLDGAEKNSQMTLEHIIKAWGHPTNASKVGNCAAHHALAAGYCEGLDLLEHIMLCHDAEGASNNDNMHRYLSLISQPNSNADTPLMMACVNGHVAMLQHVLQRSFSLALSAHPDDGADAVVKDTWKALQDIFAMRNNEQYTTLSFASGHGHADIVALCIQPQSVLLDRNSLEVVYVGSSDKSKPQKEDDTASNLRVYDLEPLVGVSYADVEFCKTTVDDLADGLKYMQQQNQADRIKEFESQHRQAIECLVMLERELERISADAASDLLLDGGNGPNGATATPHKGKAPRKSKKKKQKRKKPKQQSQQHVAIDGSDVQSPEENGSRHKGWAAAQDKSGEDDLTPPINASPFITLHDGSVVPKHYNPEDVLPIDSEETTTSEDGNAKPKPLQTILISSSDNHDIIATMESLCLDPSMLLLSSHGMAMEMSPSQLESVASILTHQLDATREAQRIQSRLLNKK